MNPGTAQQHRAVPQGAYLPFLIGEVSLCSEGCYTLVDMRDFRISNAQSGRNFDAASNLLIQPRLWVPDQATDYPGHLEWRDKALSEIETSKKMAMVAFWGSDEVAICVYQRDPADSTQLEIRNLSVEPSARGRGLAAFVLRQVENEALIDFPGVQTIVADVKRTNLQMIRFAIGRGFGVDGVTRLEGSFAHNGVEDVMLKKPLPLPRD